MTLFIHNTLTRKKEEFVPLDANHVGMYVCGPTVYDYAHIGNARPVVIFDVLYRLLRSIYPQVTYVRNITDIDDKIMKAAAERGEDISDITQRYTDAYLADMSELGALTPDIMPRATQHVDQMIHMISDLIKRNHAYEAEGHVLFAVKTLPTYGALSKVNQDDMLAGARVEVAPYKKDAADFILWKPSSDDQPGWDSPWGRGRPGWHIECSAMSGQYLGESFDIHGGGQDLMFPHHENEMAQSHGCHGEGTFARYWMHNGMLMVNGEKMSKSLGNFYTVHDLLEHIPGEVIRFVLLATHYRQPLDWTENAVHQATQCLDRFYTALRGIETHDDANVSENVIDALCDDLNTPLAISHLHELTSDLNKETDPVRKQELASVLKKSASFLGILQKDPESWFQGDDDTTDIESLIKERETARANKNFKRSDDIRDELLERGIALEDTPQGTLWKKINTQS